MSLMLHTQPKPGAETGPAITTGELGAMKLSADAPTPREERLRRALDFKRGVTETTTYSDDWRTAFANFCAAIAKTALTSPRAERQLNTGSEVESIAKRGERGELIVTVPGMKMHRLSGVYLVDGNRKIPGEVYGDEIIFPPGSSNSGTLVYLPKKGIAGRIADFLPINRVGVGGVFNGSGVVSTPLERALAAGGRAAVSSKQAA